MPKKNNRKNNASSWASTLRNPFSSTSCHIPDDQTMDAGLVSSKMYLPFSPTAIALTSSTHNGGLLLLPHPSWAYYSLYETSAGSQTLTDLNIAGTAWIGNNGGVSNVSALAPYGARVRCVSMGLRVTYEGTELQRGGRYFAGLCPIQYAANTVATTGTYLSPLSTVCGGVTSGLTNMKQCMTNMATARVSDGTFEFTWFPNGTPTYQYKAGSAGEWNPFTTSPGVGPIPNSAFNTPYGGPGVQTGQNAVVFFIENDNTAAAQLSGNSYSIEVVWHWEVIPASPASVAYDLTPSRSNFAALQTALNSVTLKLGGVSHEASMTNAGPGPRTQNLRITYDRPKPQNTGRRMMNAATQAWNNLPREAKTALIRGAGTAGAAAIHKVRTAILSPAERRTIGM